MKFDYKKLSAKILRPIIPIEILHNGNSIRYEVLVDSGADMNIVPSELAQPLGIDVESGRKEYVNGITGGGLPYYVHQVTIKIGGWPYTVEMGFMLDMPPFGYGVVGQRGFFEHFKVVFDRQRAEIELKPYNRA